MWVDLKIAGDQMADNFDKAADAVAGFGASEVNMPGGYKWSGREYGASDAQDGPIQQARAINGDLIITGAITVITNSTEEFVRQMKNHANRTRGQHLGGGPKGQAPDDKN